MLPIILALLFGLVEVQASFVISLNSDDSDSKWNLVNKNGSIKIPASVPGGVYSDLHRAGLIGDILEGFNDVMTRWVAKDEWTYETEFNVEAGWMSYRTINLVFHGVDTVAYIEVNDNPVGSTDNMFIRYVFDVKPHLQEGVNTLKVSFTSPIEAAKKRSDKYFTAPDCVPNIYNGECHANQLRKMQASFSWDWGPAFPSVGIWKPAVLEIDDGAIIRYVTTHYEKQNNNWLLNVIVYLESSKVKERIEGHLEATMTVEANQTIEVATDVNVFINEDGTGEAKINMTISENVVSLWWPNGYGEQPLYELNIYYSDNIVPNTKLKHTVKVGFRTVELVEEDAANKLGNTTAAKGLTFYFKVNGYPLFMKGSNWIPAHILPEYGSNQSIVDNLLLAARDVHMGMIRVWGGGVYESDYFYQRCDELGILVWQDLLFACAMYPVDAEFLESVKKEVDQNVIRLQHHPSIAVWAGNNENEAALRGNWYGTQSKFQKYKQEYKKLYVDTIKPIIENIDPGRRFLVSSPSNGIESESEGHIAKNPYDPHYGDTHYYNYWADSWDFGTYPETRFASEYGFQSLPSLATMGTATKNPDDYHLDSKYSKHRQHSPSGYASIERQIAYQLKLNKSDTEYFKKFVFYSQISQAMAIKVETEFYRQNQESWFTMGALYWQLNDVWQAPSWSGIEYGGRWKMLHYFAKTFFAPVLVSCRPVPDNKVRLYILNDRLVPTENVSVSILGFRWDSLKPFQSTTYTANVDPLSSTKLDKDIDLSNSNDPDTYFVRLTMETESVKKSPFNYWFPVPLKDIKGLKTPNIQISVINDTVTPSGVYQFNVDIYADTIVLFLWLKTENLDGQFEDNGMIVTEPHIRVKYFSKNNITPDLLEASITFQYYSNE